MKNGMLDHVFILERDFRSTQVFRFRANLHPPYFPDGVKRVVAADWWSNI